MRKIILKITIPWWAIFYTKSVLFFASCFNAQPDTDKLLSFILKHKKIKVVKV